MRKRTVTTIEMRQIVTVRRRAGAALARCPACLKEVETVSLEEAALLAGVSLRDICRRVADDHLHFVETAAGCLVCAESILDTVSSGDGGLSSGGADTLRLPPAKVSDAADW